jgi:mono/diheme cytochrome c family protein
LNYEKGYKMKKELIIGLAWLILVITACAGQASQTPAKPAVPTQPAPPASTSANPATGAQSSGAGVSFTKNVMPILQNSCTSCHGTDQMKAGLDLRTYKSLMAGSSNGTVIVPGNSADSFLVQQVVNGKMPKRGSKLTPDQIKTISDWITAGATNN